MKRLIGKILLKLHKLFPKHIPVMTCYSCLIDDCINRTKGKNKICDGYIKNEIKGIGIKDFPQYFIKFDFDGFIVEIDIRKLNFIQKMILRILGIKITKYDEKIVEKLTQKS